MRCALLVARREFAEIAKTRGFWIGMLGLPVLVLLSMQGLLWLERKATPVRYFVLLDRSGGLGPAVRTALDRYRATRKSGPLRPVPQRRLLNLRVFFITIKITDERHPRTPEPQKHLRADHSVHRFVRPLAAGLCQGGQHRTQYSRRQNIPTQRPSSPAAA